MVKTNKQKIKHPRSHKHTLQEYLSEWKFKAESPHTNSILLRWFLHMKTGHWAYIPLSVPSTLTPGEETGQDRVMWRQKRLLSCLTWMRAGWFKSFFPFLLLLPFQLRDLFVHWLMYMGTYMHMLIDPKKQRHRVTFPNSISLTNWARALPQLACISSQTLRLVAFI